MIACDNNLNRKTPAQCANYSSASFEEHAQEHAQDEHAQDEHAQTSV